MRTAALALVLIVGAVVILIFANTLNSWVLGGLIGGLAALLISIPISLVLFTILARRHDTELHALQQELEEMAFAEEEYAENEYSEVYEADAYILPDEEGYYAEPRARRAHEIHSLPAAGQSQASAQANMAFNQRMANYAQGNRQSSQALSQERGRGTHIQRQLLDRQHRRTAYEINAMRSRHQTAALRAARREAAQEFDDVEVVSNSTSPYKRVPHARSSQPLSEQSTRFKQARPTRQLPPQQETAHPGRSRRNMPPADAYSPTRIPRTDALHMSQPQTDQLRDHSLQTEPFSLHPQTGQFIRNPQLGEQLRNPDVVTGSLKNPLVRRAPYMYEDDPLREELAQQIDGPIVRRSSRYLQYEDGEE